jgi:hypothetical protein
MTISLAFAFLEVDNEFQPDLIVHSKCSIDRYCQPIIRCLCYIFKQILIQMTENTPFLTDSSNLSKVLKKFEDAGIMFSIMGKRQIKK